VVGVTSIRVEEIGAGILRKGGFAKDAASPQPVSNCRWDRSTVSFAGQMDFYCEAVKGKVHHLNGSYSTVFGRRPVEVGRATSQVAYECETSQWR